MKLKIVAGIIGGVVVIAGIVFFIVKHSETGKVETDNSGRKQEKKTNKDTTDLSVKKELIEHVNLDDTKKEAVETITERHEEAKTIMAEAVKNITSEELPEETQNEETKKKLFDEIDNL